MLKNVIMSTTVALVCLSQLYSESEGMRREISGKNVETPRLTKEEQKETGSNSSKVKERINYIPRKIFSDMSGVRYVVLPKGIKVIHKRTFDYMSLEQVEIGSGLERVCNGAFYRCFLQNVICHNVPESEAFYECSGGLALTLYIENVDRQSSIYLKDVFVRCVTFLKDIKAIPAGLFSDCRDLEKVEFNGEVKKIDNGSFYKCSSLQKVIFHNVPKYYESQVFQDCGHRVKVKLVARDAYEKKSISVICDDVWQLQEKAGRPDMYVHFTDHFTPALNDKNINFCKELTDLAYNGRVVPEVFAACCPRLDSAVIEAEVVGKGAFAGCANLMHLKLVPPIKMLGSYCFCDCVRLGSIILPNSIKSISNRAFQNCINLVFVDMNEGLETIGIDAFYGCSKLSYINLPRSLRKIGGGAFVSTSLRCVPPSWPLDYIPGGCFMGCNLMRSVDTLKFREIGINAFKNCVGLEKVKIWPGVQVLDEAFNGCENLRMLEILAPNVRLCNGCFTNCPSLNIANIFRAEYAPRFLENGFSLLDYSCNEVFDSQVQFAAAGRLFTQNLDQYDEEEEEEEEEDVEVH